MYELYEQNGGLLDGAKKTIDGLRNSAFEKKMNMN